MSLLSSKSMYKRDRYITENIEIIHEIYKYIVDYLENENIVIRNTDNFYDNVCDYIYVNSSNAYKPIFE